MGNLGTGDWQSTNLMKQYINDVLDTGRLSYGPYSQRFEKDFSKLHDNRYGVLSNSGTSSLLVALQSLKEIHNWQDGDEVIVPALTFVATINIVLQCGLKPVLVDIEPDYYGIDIDKIYLAITKKTKAIIPVHLFGQPCNITNIQYYNRDSWGLKIIEDSCETVLATQSNKPVGSYSDIACFSFYNAHLLTTGIGGMSITNNSEYALKMRSLVNHGLEYKQLSKSGEYNPMLLSRSFKFNSVGHSFRITELEAAIGVAQLETIKDDIKKRQDNAAYMTWRLKEYKDEMQLPAIRPHCTHSFMMYPIVMLNEKKNKIMAYLSKNGIGVRDMMPLTNQPVYNFNEDDYPVAKWVNEQGFYIGCHQYMSTGDLDYMVLKIKEWFE